MKDLNWFYYNKPILYHTKKEILEVNEKLWLYSKETHEENIRIRKTNIDILDSVINNLSIWEFIKQKYF